MEIKFFNESIENFIAELENPTIAKVLRTIDLLGQFGSNLGMPHSKKIGRDLFELRVRGKQEIRIIYTFHKKAILLLCAFIKKTQRIPGALIRLSEKRLNSLDHT